MSECKVSSDSVLMTHTSFFNSNSFLIFVEWIEDPNPTESYWSETEHKPNHKPRNEVAALLEKVPEMLLF